VAAGFRNPIAFSICWSIVIASHLTVISMAGGGSALQVLRAGLVNADNATGILRKGIWL